MEVLKDLKSISNSLIKISISVIMIVSILCIHEYPELISGKVIFFVDPTRYAAIKFFLALLGISLVSKRLVRAIIIVKKDKMKKLELANVTE